jgi:hypothetical protein
MLRAQRAPLDRNPESQRYWTGVTWSRVASDAMLFPDTGMAKHIEMRAVTRKRARRMARSG